MSYAYEDPKKRGGKKAPAGVLVVGTIAGVIVGFIVFDGNPGFLGGAACAFAGVGVAGATYKLVTWLIGLRK